MYPSSATDIRAATDEDAATQVIDGDMHASAAVRNKPINTQRNDGKLGSAQMNTDDLCTQVFDADVHVSDRKITAANPEDFEDDLPTQVFDELSEKVEPLTDKGKKAAKGGGRAKKTAKNSMRKVRDENLDSLETQVFDGFVPPAPPGRQTQSLQSDEVVDDRVDTSEMEVVVTSGRRTRGRMSLKSSHKETLDLAAVNKASTIASVTDTNLKAVTGLSSVDDLATQVFDADAGTDNISAIPSTSSCLDNVATQVFDSVPSLSSTTEPAHIVPRTKDPLSVSYGSLLNLKLDTDTEDVATQVFDMVDPFTEKRNAGSSRTSRQNYEAADTGMKTSSRAAGRRMKKSVGLRQTDLLAAADDVPGDQMDDVATQVFDAEPLEKPSRNSKIQRLSLSHPGTDGSDVDVGKSRKSRSKPGNRSDAVDRVDEELRTEQEEEDEESATRDEISKSRRLSSRSNKSKHRTREASLSAVPEDAEAGKPRAGRSQRKRLTVAGDTSGPLSDIQPPSCDTVNVDSSKTSSSASEDTDAGKPKAARLRGKRAKPENLSVPNDTFEPAVSVEALYSEVHVEGATKPADRRQRRSKKEPAQLAKKGKSAQSDREAAELVTGKTAEADTATEKPAGVVVVDSTTPGKKDGKKTKKLYTAKGLSVFICLASFVFCRA